VTTQRASHRGTVGFGIIHSGKEGDTSNVTLTDGESRAFNQEMTKGWALDYFYAFDNVPLSFEILPPGYPVVGSQACKNLSLSFTVRSSMIYWLRYYIWEGTSMREYTLLIAFVLLIVGTIGLLINELILDWGRCATLTFAIINVVGLISLAFAYWTGRKTQ